MSAHSVPLHCPYCAGEDLHPHGETHGAWECRECLRAFSVKFHGLLAPQTGPAPRPAPAVAPANAPATSSASTSGGHR